MPSDLASLSSTTPSVAVEVTVQNFMQEVVQPSLQTPVLVYFTAPWCGPCKQFGPLLEKVVRETKGKVKLAKVDVDKQPQLAQQFRVQSVPMVYIFAGGQPLDGFAGALPESQLKQIFMSLAPAGAEEEDTKLLLDQAAEALKQQQAEQALALYQAVLRKEPEHVGARAGSASALIQLGQLEEAEALLAALPEDSATKEEVSAAKAQLVLKRQAPATGSQKELEAALQRDPANHQARMDLACLLLANGKPEEAMDALLEILRKDRQWNEGAAHQKLLTFFEALGFDHPACAQGRRKLSNILFR